MDPGFAVRMSPTRPGVSLDARFRRRALSVRPSSGDGVLEKHQVDPAVRLLDAAVGDMLQPDSQGVMSSNTEAHAEVRAELQRGRHARVFVVDGLREQIRPEPGFGITPSPVGAPDAAHAKIEAPRR